MESESLTLAFPDTSLDEGNRLAGSLQECLRDADPDVQVERQRERQETQDFGATLAVVLGSAAVTAVAKGIAAWLARNSGARLEVRQGNGSVVVLTNLDSQDVPGIVQALSRLT